MPSLATTPGNRLVIPLSSSFKLPPQGGPRGGSSRSGPPRPCALLVVLRLHRDRARDDALLDGVDVVLELLGHLAVEVVVRGDADAVVLQGADVGAALELVVDGALDGRLDRDVHVLLDAGQEQAAVLLRALAAVGVHPDHVLVATGRMMSAPWLSSVSVTRLPLSWLVKSPVNRPFCFFASQPTSWTFALFFWL